MLQRVKSKWAAIRPSRKYGALMLAQVWFWPQVFNNSIPPATMFSLAVTACVAIVLNLVRLINALEDGC